MESLPLPLACALLLVARYWAQAFPNTRMPDVISARFRPVKTGLQCMGSGNKDPRFLYSDFSKENRDPRENTLFLEKDLKVGMNKILYFRKLEFSCASLFLSRVVADAIPFSSAELPRILQRFSFPPASSEAVEVGVTLKWCESLEAGEKCLTSLAAMIDYATTSAQDHNITMLRTSINPSSTVCHNMPYPYAVYYCHYVGEGRIYEVSMKAEDGSTVEAIATCHADTKDWAPIPMWFQVLPVGKKADQHNYACHFLPDMHVIWASV
ncbi:hypothetical protein AMTRI_Chr09g20460 [Amborella trichopoda]